MDDKSKHRCSKMPPKVEIAEFWSMQRMSAGLEPDVMALVVDADLYTTGLLCGASLFLENIEFCPYCGEKLEVGHAD